MSRYTSEQRAQIKAAKRRLEAARRADAEYRRLTMPHGEKEWKDFLRWQEWWRGR